MIFIKKHVKTLRRKDKKTLTELPEEILINILQQIPKNELVKIWHPIIYRNRALSVAICDVLTKDVYFYNAPLMMLQLYFNINYKKFLVRYPTDTTIMYRDLSRIVLYIFKFASTNFNIQPRGVVMLFALTSIASCFSLLRLISIIDESCQGKGSDLKVYVHLNSMVRSFPMLPHLHSLHISHIRQPMVIQNYSVTDLILDGDVVIKITSYPQNLRHLLVNPSQKSFGKVCISLLTLPTTIKAVLLGENVRIKDAGCSLPNMSSFVCRVQHPESRQLVQDFISKNSIRLKYLQIKGIKLNAEDSKMFINLEVLFLWKSFDIPYHKFQDMRCLKSLWLLDCDLRNLSKLTMPDNLRDIRIAPCNATFLNNNLPVNLRNKITEENLS